MNTRILASTLGLALFVSTAPAALVYQFGFEEANGPVIDAQTGLSLALNENATRVPSTAPINPALGSKAFSLDGSKDKAFFYSETSPGAGFDTANAPGLTIMGFANITALPTGTATIASISRGGTGSTGSSRINFGVTPTGQIRAGGRKLDGDGFQSATSAAGVVTAGTWIHLAVTLNYSNNSISFFANGEFLSTSTGINWGVGTASSNTYSNGIAIGSNSASATSGEQFGGLIDELRVYNTALTPAEITSVYAAQIPEPSSIGLAMLASVGMLGLRRRR